MRDPKSVSVTVGASLVLSVALSISFYLVYGVFDAAGFVIWSIVSGVVGGFVGELLIGTLPGGLLLTAIIRIGVFIALSGLVF
jgi:hypothetical protein